MSDEREPWLVNDVWSDDYDDDVEALDRAAQGLGWGFVIVALVLFALLVLFVQAGGPAGLYRLLLQAAGT